MIKRKKKVEEKSAQIDSRKARERELATFDENRRAVGMLNPMRDKRLKARTEAEKGRNLRPQLVQKLESKSETKEGNKTVSPPKGLFLVQNIDGRKPQLVAGVSIHNSMRVDE